MISTMRASHRSFTVAEPQDRLPQEWLDKIERWAAQQPEIARVWAYGSRVKGGAKPDSDLDLAFTTNEANGEAAYTVAFFNQDRWQSELQFLMPISVHLQYADEDDDFVVWPAIIDHGFPVYDASACVSPIHDEPEN